MPELAQNSGLPGPPSPMNQRVKTKKQKKIILIYIYLRFCKGSNFRGGEIGRATMNLINMVFV
jgi:hypothetical protein